MLTRIPDYQPPSTANRQGLTAYPLAQQLGIWVVGTVIAFDELSPVIDGPSLEGGPFEDLAQPLSSHAGIDLRHGERVVAEQSTNDVEGDIIVEQPHPDRVPE